MEDPKKLYVDVVTDDKTVGVVENQLSIHYNLFILDRVTIDKSPVFTAGRYICILSSDGKKATMRFFDFVKNPIGIQPLLAQVETPLRQRFISLMEAHNTDYELTKNNVILIQGDSPARPI